MVLFVVVVCLYWTVPTCVDFPTNNTAAYSVYCSSTHIHMHMQIHLQNNVVALNATTFFHDFDVAVMVVAVMVK